MLPKKSLSLSTVKYDEIPCYFALCHGTAMAFCIKRHVNEKFPLSCVNLSTIFDRWLQTRLKQETRNTRTIGLKQEARNKEQGDYEWAAKTMAPVPLFPVSLFYVPPNPIIIHQK
ncbi:MAG TPA: hypothetical protein VGO47_12870 [Chlamydiales bacterium]|nr:hypothetical protein [Chlamydiales bacterium]